MRGLGRLWQRSAMMARCILVAVAAGISNHKLQAIVVLQGIIGTCFEATMYIIDGPRPVDERI
jgi:hypothetical protein